MEKDKCLLLEKVSIVEVMWLGSIIGRLFKFENNGSPEAMLTWRNEDQAFCSLYELEPGHKTSWSIEDVVELTLMVESIFEVEDDLHDYLWCKINFSGGKEKT